MGLPSQLPAEDLRRIGAADELIRVASPKLEVPSPRVVQQRRLAMQRVVGAHVCTLHGPVKSSGDRPKDFPHVACKCCKHPGPKPWLEKRTLSAAASALVAAAIAPLDVSTVPS